MLKKTAEVVKAYDNDKIGKYFLPNVQKEWGGGQRRFDQCSPIVTKRSQFARSCY